MIKKIIISLLLIFSINSSSVQPQQFSDQQKAEKVTGYFIKLLDNLIEKNALTAVHLQHMHHSPELINPMTPEDRAASSTHLVYAKGLDSFIEQGKLFIDITRVKVWIATKINELQRNEDTRQQVHEDTREIHRPMRFVSIPAGKYIDEISHEEFEIPEGIEIQDTPVTQWQWVQVTGKNSSYFLDGFASETHNQIKMRPDAPVENVSWDNVQAFIKILDANNADYDYALPSVQEYQAVMQAALNKNWIEQILKYKSPCQGKEVKETTCPVATGPYLELNGRRIWDIMGNVWQWTRDYVETKDKQAHVVFGSSFATDTKKIMAMKDILRPVLCSTSKRNNIGLRIIRYKQVCNQILKHYTAQQLSWKQEDAPTDFTWQWDAANQRFHFPDDGLRWMLEHKTEYSQETQHTLNIFLEANPDPAETLMRRITLMIPFHEIKDVSPLQHLINLNYLEIYNNQIQDIGPLKHLTNLTWLTLSNNQIQDISPLQHLTKLEIVDLRQNPIQDLTPLKSSKNLHSLYLDKRQIERLNPYQILPGVMIKEY